MKILKHGKFWVKPKKDSVAECPKCECKFDTLWEVFSKAKVFGQGVTHEWYCHCPECGETIFSK